jgi:putative chitinase
VTLDDLQSVVPRCPRLRLALLMPYLTDACEEFEIMPRLRLAAFLAQTAYESAEYRHFEEITSGEAYEGRSDLGNNHAGDGSRYKGRGPLQITGRYNYRKYGKAIGVDLETYPKLASSADIAFRVSGAFWKLNGLNQLADESKFDDITRRINGGLAGKAQRDTYYMKALAVLHE